MRGCENADVRNDVAVAICYARPLEGGVFYELGAPETWTFSIYPRNGNESGFGKRNGDANEELALYRLFPETAEEMII